MKGNFFSELKRRNVYKVAVAYGVVGWLVIQVTATIVPALHLPDGLTTAVVVLVLVGFPIALVISWAFEMTPEGLKRTANISADEVQSMPYWSKKKFAAFVVGVAVIAGGLFAYQLLRAPRSTTVSKSDNKSIAVLPFVDISPAKDQEYFCDGISEEILDTLAQVEGLRVVARTSSFSFKGKNSDVAEIAQKLNVQNVLEGSLRREGNRIRVTAQLINARDGFHLWSETYERELQGVFAVQDEITRAIVDALKVKLAVAVPAHRDLDGEAHDLYLQGLYFSNKSDEANLRKSLTLFQRALDKDPNSARAWAGIAKAWDWLSDAYMNPLDAFPLTKAAALKAIALDANNAEAHVYLADVKRVLDWDMAGADAELRHALQLDPNSASAHLFSSLNALTQGNPEAGAAHMREAVKADPLSPLIANLSAEAYLLRGQYDEAIAEGKRTQELDPNYIYQTSVIADAYREKEMYDEAIALFKKAQEMTGTAQPGLAVTYARIGRQSEARQILEELKKTAATKYLPKEEIAAVYVALGEKDEAFKWLNRACDDHGGALHAIGLRPVFRALHSDPRFADILRRIGLDPAKVLSQP
ncbi:MAG: FlgO family outer membrane protein, partial [Nitrosotalea sp.]